MSFNEKQKLLHFWVLAKLLKDVLLGGLGEQTLQMCPIPGHF